MIKSYIKIIIKTCFIISIMTLIALILSDCFPQRQREIFMICGMIIAYIDEALKKKNKKNENLICPYCEKTISNIAADYCPKCGHKMK